MKVNKSTLLVMLVAVTSLPFLGNACDKGYKLSTAGLASNSASGTVSQPGGGNGTSGAVTQPGGTQTTLKSIQPALAVRDISCLACHANVQANVITDFGYGNSWFMNQNGNVGEFGQGHYMSNTWQTIQNINGQVFVPTATVPANVVNSMGLGNQSMDLMAYLNDTSATDIGGENGWFSYWGLTAPASTPLTLAVTPPAGSPTVVEESNIYIGAPTSAEILAIVTAPQASAPWVQVLNNIGPGITGLGSAQGSKSSYITNTGTVECSNNDVIINGTLLLNNLQIYAEKGGCRLYVTGSVFIEGPITYLQSGSSADPTQNLQITSATSIILGVGINGSVWDGGGGQHTGTVAGNQQSTTPLQDRLLGDFRDNMLLREAQTTTAYTSYATGILNEGENIGSSLLVDAANATGLPTSLSAAGQTRASINYEHLLLNAPMIHSRYLGTTQGVIVAESAEFSLGEFSFQYDSVFENVNVLPALPYDILCTSSTCTPAQ
jgi:hypothetical protein